MFTIDLRRRPTPAAAGVGRGVTAPLGEGGNLLLPSPTLFESG